MTKSFFHKHLDRKMGWSDMKDYSTVTVSLNMKDYQALKKAAYRNEEDWKKQRGVEEAYEEELAHLKKLLRDQRAINESRIKAYQCDARQAVNRANELRTQLAEMEDRYDKLYNDMETQKKDVNVKREREVVVRYLREVADSVEQLKEDEDLGLYAVTANGECTCD